MKTSTALKRGRAKIADPKRWTRWTVARDKNGNPVPLADRRARSWCASGALPGHGFTDAMGRLCDAAEVLSGGATFSAAHYNNSREHADVLEMFDLALSMALSEEAAR